MQYTAFASTTIRTPEQTNRERDFAAQWQGDAEKLQNLNLSDRDALAKNLRQALGKTKSQKTHKSSRKKSEAPPGGVSSVAAGGKGFDSSGAGGSGVRGGRSAAGEQRITRKKGNLNENDSASTSARQGDGQRVYSVTTDGAVTDGTRFSDGVAAVLGIKESVTAPASSPADAGREGTPDSVETREKDASEEVGVENASSQGGGETAGVGEEAATSRVMAFGRGVTVVPESDRSTGSKNGPEKVSPDDDAARKFGGGVATAVETSRIDDAVRKFGGGVVKAVDTPSSAGPSSSVGASSPVDVASVGDLSSGGDVSSVGNASSVGDASSVLDVSSVGDMPSVGDVTSLGDVSSAGDVSSSERGDKKGISIDSTDSDRIRSFGGGVAIPGKTD